MDTVTRFPPEPNGYLHLGHVKAMVNDFEYNPNSKCILRMDDTNPETEKQEYVDAIIEDVLWLGYNPSKITATSDYFDQLIEYAKLLIKNNYAYVDFSSSDEITSMRSSGTESKYRTMDSVWHLEEFNKMTCGEYKEGECCLRLKIDMQNKNHTLRDPVAYRIKYTSHYKTGKKYCVYPSYDYSHGIIDALENITYSYCTIEFYVRREQYYWPVNRLIELGLGSTLKPAEVLEFGRLSVENNFLSKRKIIDLFNQNKIDGFDDPRLLTIRGLRRRGFTPDLLKKIIKENTTIERNDTMMTESLLQHYLRNCYNENAIRVFGVMDPITVSINNAQPDKLIVHPNHPTNKDLGEHIQHLTNKIYIDKSDFREADQPNYYRLAPGKTIRLKYADFYKYENHNENEIVVSPVEPLNPKQKIKGIIHWISSTDAIDCIYYVYDSLLAGNEFNQRSKICYHGKIERYVIDMINKDKALIFQLERVGFFKFDSYSKDNKPIFIKVVQLTDSYKQ